MLSRLSHFAWTSLLLRWVLVFAVWTGPVPYCHCHGTLSDTSSHSLEWLMSHLQARHGTDVLFADIDFGWHLHVHFPDPDEDVEQPDWLSWQGGGTKLVTLSDWERLDFQRFGAWAEMSWRPPVSADLTGWNTRTFFASFAPTLPLPLRFGIARC